MTWINLDVHRLHSIVAITALNWFCESAYLINRTNGERRRLLGASRLSRTHASTVGQRLRQVYKKVKWKTKLNVNMWILLRNWLSLTAVLIRFDCSFIVSFSNNAPDPERDSAAVQNFFAQMEVDFRVHPLWAGCSEEELDSAGEVSC